jgi:hypothetical protein
MKTQFSSLQHKQTLLKIMIFTLVTVIIWVGLTLFRTQRETGITPKQQLLAEPLNPNINMSVLERLEQKRYYTPEELADFPIYSLVVTKAGEEQLVVFSAADRSQRPATGLETIPTGGQGEQAPAPPTDPLELPPGAEIPPPGETTVETSSELAPPALPPGTESSPSEETPPAQ